MTQEGNRVVTFGCRLNAFESELIKQAADKSDQKNLIIFNSCAVTAEAERQLGQAVRRARRENQDAKIVVVGCAAQINPEKYASMKEVDLVLGNQEKSRAESYIDFQNNKKYDNNFKINSHQDAIFLKEKQRSKIFLNDDESAKIKVNDIMSVKETSPQLVSYFENRTRAFLEIQNGCNHRCTFCIIPFGRGNSRSVAFGDIVLQVKKLVENGHKEIVFTGVDISDYGKDLSIKITLAQMIKRLLKLIPQLPRLRLSSIDVAEIDEEMIDLIASEERFMPYLHLSVQSGDDMILKRMKRRHNRAQVLGFCANLRKLRPEITFGSDIIAGFPTENDEMFENSLNLISEAGLIFNHIFPYSKRAGTPAASMPQLDKKIIKNRAEILRKKSEFELKKYLQNQVQKEFEVIVEKNNFAKTKNFLDVKIENYDVAIIGKMLKIKAVDIENNYLIGKILH